MPKIRGQSTRLFHCSHVIGTPSLLSPWTRHHRGLHRIRGNRSRRSSPLFSLRRFPFGYFDRGSCTWASHMLEFVAVTQFPRAAVATMITGRRPSFHELPFQVISITDCGYIMMKSQRDTARHGVRSAGWSCVHPRRDQSPVALCNYCAQRIQLENMILEQQPRRDFRSPKSGVIHGRGCSLADLPEVLSGRMHCGFCSRFGPTVRCPCDASLQ